MNKKTIGIIAISAKKNPPNIVNLTNMGSL